jgi:hypothetical protein
VTPAQNRNRIMLGNFLAIDLPTRGRLFWPTFHLALPSAIAVALAVKLPTFGD